MVRIHVLESAGMPLVRVPSCARSMPGITGYGSVSSGPPPGRGPAVATRDGPEVTYCRALTESQEDETDDHVRGHSWSPRGSKYFFCTPLATGKMTGMVAAIIRLLLLIRESELA